MFLGDFVFIIITIFKNMALFTLLAKFRAIEQ